MCISINSFSQKNDDVLCYSMNKGNYCWMLHTFNNNAYILECTWNGTHDIVFDFQISRGKYNIKEDSMILVDSEKRFKICLLLRDKLLLTNNSTVFWNNDTLKYDGVLDNVQREYEMMSLRKGDSLDKVEKPSYIGVSKKVTSGKYKSWYGNESIMLNQDSSYTFSLNIDSKDGLCLSKGRWERKKDKIILFDSILRHRFIGTILKDDKIYMNLLGCDRYGIFYLIRDN